MSKSRKGFPLLTEDQVDIMQKSDCSLVIMRYEHGLGIGNGYQGLVGYLDKAAAENYRRAEARKDKIGVEAYFYELLTDLIQL